jgi:hypothetical protein
MLSRRWVRFGAGRVYALGIVLASLGAVCLGGAMTGPAATATGCTTHQCDSLSTDFYGGRMTDPNTYETSDWNEDWVDYPGEVTVRVHFPAGNTRVPVSIDSYVGTGLSPNGGPDFQPGESWVLAGGQLAELFFLDQTGFSVTNGSCAAYYARFVAHFPPEGITLFGGLGPTGDAGIGTLNDTWTWDGMQWTGQGSAPTAGPEARERASLVRAANAVLLFGGYDDDAPQPYLFDTWTWDGATWAPMYFASPYPTARADAASAVVNGTLVLFGGEGPGPTDLGDTWTWDGVLTDTWATPGPSVAPSPRSGASAATLGGNVVLFGGRSSGTPLGDTWIWDGSTWTQQLVPGPSPRFHAAMVSLGPAVLLFGGDSGSGDLADTWLWDGTAWTQQNVAGPSARSEASAAPLNGTVVLFGGSQGTAMLDDMWTWKAGAWTQQFAGGPTARAGAAATTP